MLQQTFTDVEYSRRRIRSRRELFLDTMEGLVPWKECIDLISPYYPSGRRGRPVKGVETMLRMLLLQKWFGLSDAGTEDAVCDSYAMRSFMHIDFTSEQVPDSSTLRRFRMLLRKHGLEERLDEIVSRSLEGSGVKVLEGCIREASAAGAASRVKRK